MPEDNPARRHLLTRRAIAGGASIAALLLAAAMPAHAQYLGLNLRGDTGLKSGSQPGPGYYFVLPLYYRADYTSHRRRRTQRRLGMNLQWAQKGN